MALQTRRDFLQDTLLAASATLAASQVTTAIAAEKQSSSPNERLRVAVLGVNGRGGSHIAGFGERKDTEVVVVCDPDANIGPRRADAITEQNKKAGKGECHFVQDLRKVFEDKSIDIVSIATPNHWHALAAIWAIQAGKDVYVEKPVSHNVSEGRRIVEAARKYDKICQTGTQSRSSPSLHEAMAYLNSGALGDVVVARGLCYKPRPSIGKVTGEQPIPKGIDYNLWSGPAPINKLNRAKLHYDWHWVWDYGNGDLGNQGIHQMDIARWAMGQQRLADEIVTLGGRFGYVDDGETPNTEITFFKYGAQQLIFEVRGLPTDAYPKAGAGVGVVIHCTKGYLAIPNYVSAIAYDGEGKELKRFKGGGDSLHYANFVKAVRSRSIGDLNADIEQGHLSSALCHLGNISYRLGRPESFADATKFVEGNAEAAETLARTKAHLTARGVKLDDTNIQVGARLAFNAKTETFVENSQADAMLTRDYRAPFVVPKQGQV